jgi:hypothetical protein
MPQHSASAPVPSGGAHAPLPAAASPRGKRKATSPPKTPKTRAAKALAAKLALSHSKQFVPSALRPIADADTADVDDLTQLNEEEVTEESVLLALQVR